MLRLLVVVVALCLCWASSLTCVLVVLTAHFVCTNSMVAFGS